MMPLSSPRLAALLRLGVVFLCHISGPRYLVRWPFRMLVERDRPDVALPIQFHCGVRDPFGPERALDDRTVPVELERGEAGAGGSGRAVMEATAEQAGLALVDTLQRFFPLLRGKRRPSRVKDSTRILAAWMACWAACSNGGMPGLVGTPTPGWVTRPPPRGIIVA